MTAVYLCISIAFLAMMAGVWSYEQKYTIDHVYYTMSLYQDNSEGMYDKHYVDMTDSFVHTFLRLKDYSTPYFSTRTFQPGLINPNYSTPFNSTHRITLE